jgi:hypothetical protein
MGSIADVGAVELRNCLMPPTGIECTVSGQ